MVVATGPQPYEAPLRPQLTGTTVATTGAGRSDCRRRASGSSVPILWFGMDFHGAAGTEQAALQARQQYLASLAEEHTNRAAALGHEDAFPAVRLNDRCRFY